MVTVRAWKDSRLERESDQDLVGAGRVNAGHLSRYGGIKYTLNGRLCSG